MRYGTDTDATVKSAFIFYNSPSSIKHFYLFQQIPSAILLQHLLLLNGNLVEPACILKGSNSTLLLLLYFALPLTCFSW